MTVNNFETVPYPKFPIANVTPFTYRDGHTYLELVEAMRKHINEHVVPTLQANVDAFILALDDMHAAFLADLGEYRDQVVNTQTEFTNLFNQYMNQFNTSVGHVDAVYDQVVALKNDVEVISGLTGEDAAVALLVGSPTSDTRAALESVPLTASDDSVTLLIDTPASSTHAALQSRYNTKGQVRSKVKTDGTDQTVRLQAEVDALAAAGGGTLLLPAGTIYLDHWVTARSNVTIAGVGVGQTVLSCRKYAFFYFETDADGNTIGQNNPLRRFHVRDLTVDGTPQTEGYKGIALQYLIDCTFVNLEVKNTQFTGLGIDFLVDCFVMNVTTRDTGLGNDGTLPGGNGIGIGIGGFSHQGESVLVTGCHVYRAKRSGIMFEKSGYASVKGIRCIGNYVSGCEDVGIHDCGAAGMITIGNIADRNIGHGFAISQATIGASGPGYAGVMSGNFSSFNGGDGFHFDASLLAQTGKGYSLCDNTAADNGGQGIGLLTANNDVTGLVVRGNYAQRNTGSGIRMRSSGTGRFIDPVVANNFLLANGRASGNDVNNIRIDAPTLGMVVRDNDSRYGTSETVPKVGFAFTIGREHTDAMVVGQTTRGVPTGWQVGGVWNTSTFRDNQGYTHPA